MTKTILAPRILPSSELNSLSDESVEWTGRELEPRMFGISGGLSVSGGDFGFEVPNGQDDEPTNHE